MALTDTESKASTSLLSGGLTEPLTEQPGKEPEGIQLASMQGKGGSLLGRLFFGKDLFRSRTILQDIEKGKREPQKLEDLLIPKFIRPTKKDQPLEYKKDKAELSRLTKMAKKSTPGSDEQKEIIQQLNDLRTTLNMDPVEVKEGVVNFNQAEKKFLKEKETDAVPKKGLLTDFRVTGSKGDDKLPNEQSVYNTIEAMSQAHRGKIDEAKRGEMTEEVIADLADLIGSGPSTLEASIKNREKGGVINVKGFGLAETMLAARELLVTEVKKLDELAKAAQFGDDRAALAFRQQFELVAQLQAQIKGSQTEIARALGQFKIPVRGEGPGTRNLQDNDIRVLLDQFGGTEDIKAMADGYLKMGTINQKLSVTRGKKGLFGKSLDAFYEVWINALLSSPVTHTKNVVGAALVTFGHVPETFVAAGMGSFRRNIMGQKGGVQFGEARAELFGAMMAFQEAWGAASHVYRTGESPILGSKIEFGQGKSHTKAFSSTDPGVFGHGINGLGKLMTLNGVPTRMLEFEDTYFKVIAHRMSLYQQAYREGLASGKKGEDLSEYIANYVYNPPKSAIKEADEHARYVTLQSEVDKVGKKFQGLRENSYMRFFVPFFKTPYNAFKYSFKERTPLGLLSADLRETLAAGYKADATPEMKAASDMAMARLSMGSMTAAMVAMMVANGRITGGGPADSEHRGSLIRKDWQPNSILIGDTYYSYVGAEPFSSILSMAADMTEVMMHGDVSNADSGKLAMAMTLVLSNQLTDKTFMQGFSNLVAVLQDPVRYSGSAGKQFVKSLVPRIVAQGERMLDPTVRDGLTLMDSIKAQIPGLSSTLPPRRNVWGQPVMLQGAFGPDIISPIYSSTRGANYLSGSPDADVELAYEMDELFASIGYGPSRPPEFIDKNVALTLEERNNLQAIMGNEAIKIFKEWSNDKDAQKDFNTRKELFLATGNATAYDEMEMILDRLWLTARKTGKGIFMNETELGKIYRKRLEEYYKTLGKQYEQYERELR